MDESFLYIRYTILEEMKKFLETCYQTFSKRFLFDCGLQKMMIFHCHIKACANPSFMHDRMVIFINAIQ